MIEILDPDHVEALTQPSSTRRGRARSRACASALVENTKFNSDKLLEQDRRHPQGRARRGRVAMWRKHNSSVPAHDEIIDEVKETATSWSPASATEGRARRAVCSTESCWRSTASPRPRSSPTCSMATGRAMAEQWGQPELSLPGHAAPHRQPHRGGAGPARPRDGARGREAAAEGPVLVDIGRPGAAPGRPIPPLRSTPNDLDRVVLHAALVVPGPPPADDLGRVPPRTAGRTAARADGDARRRLRRPRLAAGQAGLAGAADRPRARGGRRARTTSAGSSAWRRRAAGARPCSTSARAAAS